MKRRFLDIRSLKILNINICFPFTVGTHNFIDFFQKVAKYDEKLRTLEYRTPEQLFDQTVLVRTATAHELTMVR
jgi:hypothetical protein